MEGSHSGLVRRTRNALGEKSPHRFKSCTLRPSNFMSPNITKIVKKIMPAVVSIVISENLKKIPDKLISAKNRERLKKKTGGAGNIEVGNGSGFIVDKNGIILTNKHIVADSGAEYTVITTDGNRFKAEIIAIDPINDVAILKITNRKKSIAEFPTVKLGDSDKIELGEEALAFGNALGIFKNTVSEGIISGLSRNISAQLDLKSDFQEMRGLIQTDAAINPGNSGGPLVNMKGEIIGINSVTVAGAENIGLAIPINVTKRDLADLKKYGRVCRPLLGVRYLIIDENAKRQFGLNTDYGALVINEGLGRPAIIKNSPAAIANLKEKDIILEINGEKITAEKTIGDFLDKLSVGNAIKLKILRGKKEFKIKATLMERK
ncbi:MAG: Trypsin-like protein PDZ domain serine protease [Candidatus Curtissbacteria bacterium GW2011_GWA1_40_24]|uniref:Trypsin-like protein PDZ domain serine protease n=2 Tax=Patescibacteria group TaxID=1783273 RepID=A0A0G0RSM3_9BACT|nr:MAG: Trypsin-like protein PDZ domain serine protease [Candidatus Curtissbacteria bacterium GW2011_GWA1_40_24]KKR88999.1 MAG: Trypsin-like protein PDZ domain serine protease [Candidatus Wolfebacteria bacterium GW2011_GWB1_41_12]